MLGEWILEVRSFRDFRQEIFLKDENKQPLDLNGWFAKIEVAHDDGLIVWSTATNHFSIPAPSTQGKLVLTVVQAEILTLPFEWANFSFYAGASEAEIDFICERKIHRI